jgi:hypothetical protein
MKFYFVRFIVEFTWKAFWMKILDFYKKIGRQTLFMSLEKSLSITTARCDLAIATHARKMHKKIPI